ncbi:MAG: CehA/McbA family metallohydrolase [Dehalococcoidia bacterium]
MIIDLHTHTRFGSNCSYLHPEELVQRAKQLGLDGVCITEHDLCWEGEALQTLSQENGILVIGGVEVSTDVGQVLIFGVHQLFWRIGSARELRELIDREGGAMIACHPFRGDMFPNKAPTIEEVCNRDIFKLVDAAEVFNGGATSTELNFSSQVLSKLKLKGVGGSDAHAVHTIGRCVTIFQRRISSEQDLVDELKAGRFKAWHRITNRTF